jgi:hypothetical protein
VSPAALVEHGAGQAYEFGERGGNPCYSGGEGRDTVGLFVVPSWLVGARNQTHYPEASTAVVGCPALDPWLSGERPCGEGNGTVAITFHWEASIVGPEGRGAWKHFDRALPVLARAFGRRLLGHGHPRIMGHLAHRYRALGIEVVPGYEEVLDRADLLIGDNTSAIFEVAATGRPVVVMNAPWYRRQVRDLWPRFWDHADVGLQCDDPDDLVDVVLEALQDPPEARLGRRRAVAAVYAHTDGKSAQRAAEAVVSWLQALHSA